MSALDTLYQLDAALARLNLPRHSRARVLCQQAINQLKPPIGGYTNPPEDDDTKP